MADQDSTLRVDLYQVARIVGSYVRHNQIAADQLAGLIVEVHRTLAGLWGPVLRTQPSAGCVAITDENESARSYRNKQDFQWD